MHVTVICYDEEHPSFALFATPYDANTYTHTHTHTRTHTHTHTHTVSIQTVTPLYEINSDYATVQK